MRVAIVGGGAAGLMAAAAICELDPSIEVFLIEKNDGLGKKVIISGGGRCNVTTGLTEVKTVLTKYPRGNKFLISAMHQLPPQETYRWFEGHGVPLKVEEDLRVFPVSDDGHDIVGAFERLFEKSTVRQMLKRHVVSVTEKEGGFTLHFRDGEALEVDRVVLTTGGQAYRHTGSTGDGYALAESLGHSITPLGPSLHSFITQETWPAEVSGLSSEHATLKANGTKKFSFTGPFLFTHKGVSGPAAFALSSLCAFEPFTKDAPLSLSIDLFPDKDEETLRNELMETLRKNGKKSLENVVALFVPKSLAAIVLRELSINLAQNAADIGKKDVARIVGWLKNVPLTGIARGMGDEFVTAGGVELKEVDPSTMQSKICPGLFFAGEILDIDGFTGGFNLQASWATGRLAGQSIAQGK